MTLEMNCWYECFREEEMSDKVGFVAASYHVLNVIDALCIQRILNIVRILWFLFWLSFLYYYD